MGEQSGTPGTDVRRAKRRYTPLGSVLLSFDFYLGVPLGVSAALSTIFSADVRSSLPGVLIGVAGIGAAVATLILTALAVVLGTIGSAYRRLLAQVPGGVSGLALPFRWVVGVAAGTTAWALIAAGLVPLFMSVGWATFVLAAPAFAGLLWAVFGCVQVAGQLVFYHLDQNDRANALEQRRRALHRAG